MLLGFDYSQAVSKGAAQLNVSEYELFAIAYRGWFKQETDPIEIQRYHRDFQIQGSLPHWVKHYLRQLDARTHFMAQDHSTKGMFCFDWLTRLVILMLLPGSVSLFKHLLANQKSSLYC